MNLEQHALWVADKGDATKRLEYDLTSESIIIDAGGYKGDWAAKIHERYGCEVYIYEPVKSFYEGIVKRFAGNDKIKVFNYGLGGESRNEMISVNGDAASIFGDPSEEIYIKDIYEEMFDNDMKSVDLMKINIEGGEYELLDRLIDVGYAERIKNIQIQFHDFVDNYVQRRNTIIDGLEKTHKCDWCYEFVWENWSR